MFLGRSVAVAELHGEILSFCATQEKRDCITWFFARSVFFRNVHRREMARSLADGLAYARESQPDAQFLVSLFRDGPPTTLAGAAELFQERRCDARCACWAALLGAVPKEELMMQSSAGGYALAQAVLFLHTTTTRALEATEMIELVERAVEQGEAVGMECLAFALFHGLGGVQQDVFRATELWREAAKLGNCTAQWEYGTHCCEHSLLAKVIWLRRAACVSRSWDLVPLQQIRAVSNLCSNSASLFALWDLVNMAPVEVERFRAGGTGRVLYEIGLAMAQNNFWRHQQMSVHYAPRLRVVALYCKWVAEAKTGGAGCGWLVSWAL